MFCCAHLRLRRQTKRTAARGDLPRPKVPGVFLSHAPPSQPWVRFGFSFSVSLCAPPSQPGVRSFCFCAHPRLNLGCVLVFLLVCLCAHPRLNLGCVLVFLLVCLCAHLRLNLGCVVFFLCASPSQPGMRGDMQEQHHRHKHKHIRSQSGSTLWPDTCPYQNGGFTHT